MEVSALITVQNDHLNKSTAVQVANIWQLDQKVTLMEQMLLMLATDKLAPSYTPRNLSDFFGDTKKRNFA